MATRLRSRFSDFLGYSSVAPWLAAQTVEVTASSTDSVLYPKVLRRKSSGTAADGLGTGLKFELQDAAGNVDEAGSLDVAWVTAADGATQQSVLVSRLRAANAMADVMRMASNGTGLAAGASILGATYPDVDAAICIGRILMDCRTTDSAHWSHRDMVGTAAYALRQTAAGVTILNCNTSQSLTLRYAGTTTRLTVDATGLGFYTTAGVAKQTITGSRGGNAALASVLTALATIGLFTDSTTA